MYKKMFDLSNEVALIVGGAGGIAGACAVGMAEFGADIVIADRNLEEAKKSAERISKLGVRSFAVDVDITRQDEIQSMVDSVVSKTGRIDILLNSVGATVRKPSLETTLDEWNEVLNVNLTAAFMLNNAVAKEMIKKNKGKIIHIASTGGIRAGANFSVYGASKAGLIHYLKSLALELAPYMINVNAIAPTATETAFTADFYAANPEKKNASARNHPYKRLGNVNDYVGAAVYLASHASDFVNGHVIVVDSGKTI